MTFRAELPEVRSWMQLRWQSRRLRRWLVALVLVGAVLPVSQAQPAAGDPVWPPTDFMAPSLALADVDLVDLEDEVMCVVCERPLSTSAGPAAEDQRAVMQQLINQGLTKAQIKDKLVDEYGERVLVDDGSPLAAAAPFIAAAIGAGSIVLLLRRRRSDGDGSAETGTDGDAGADGDGAADEAAGISAEDDARIDAELAERR